MSSTPAIGSVEGIPKASARKSLSALRASEALWGYFFVAPSVIGFLVFIAGPMVYSFLLSFQSWDVFTPMKYVGLQNYETLLHDTRLFASLRNTVLFVAIVVMLDVIIALALAVALQRKMPAALRYFFRTTFMLPVVTSISAIAIVLSFMLNTNLGVINYYLVQFGLTKVPWLSSSAWSLISIALATIWKSFGFDLLILIAGIQNIPTHFYEAAEIDGANGWQKFRHITLPQLSPTLFLVIVLSIIGQLQVFDQAQIMTQGGPGDSSVTIVMVIWESLSGLKLGYGSSIAVVFFLLIMGFTILQFWLSRRWVYYEGAS
jgi:multiple sugar transport system permease protein